MEAIFGFINAVTGWIWGIPILVLLVGGGLILTVVIGGIQFSRFGFIMKNTAGTMFDKEEQAREKGPGRLSVPGGYRGPGVHHRNGKYRRSRRGDCHRRTGSAFVDVDLRPGGHGH